MAKMMRIVFCIWLFFYICPTSNGQKIEFNTEAQLIYQLIIELKLNEAEAKLIRFQENNSNNYISHYLGNYIDFFKLFIGENGKEYTLLKSNKNFRISQIEKSDSNSPYFLYTLAEINLQWALIHLKFGEYRLAFFEIKSAFNSLSENRKKYPNFIPNLKSLGVLHATIGTIPDKYKWGVTLLSGMRGTISQGVSELEYVINYGLKNPNFIYFQETVAMYAFTQLHLNNDTEKGWALISKLSNPEKSPLATFAMASLAMRSGRNDVAIKVLEQRPKGKEYYPFHFLDYILGLAKLNKLDDAADFYLKKFIKNFKGKNYIKDAYQKLAWHALLRSDPAGYIVMMENVKKYGHTQVDEDINAQHDAIDGNVPNISILKGRLLFDGGYYAEAFDIFDKIDPSKLKLNHELELFYRSGRTLQKQNKNASALKKFQRVIVKGKKSNEYYICASAFNSGIIYEKLNQRAKAIQAYEMCLGLNPTAYKTSLHQKAKAGLNRLGK